MNYVNKGGPGNVSHPALKGRDSDPYVPAYEARDNDTVPTPPDHLGEVGLSVWEDVWTFGGKFYTPENDRLLITRYCELHDRRKMLLETMEADGWVVLGQRGESKIHPLFRALSDTESQLLHIEKKMGLTPEDRIRLGLARLEEEDALENWMSKQK